MRGFIKSVSGIVWTIGMTALSVSLVYAQGAVTLPKTGQIRCFDTTGAVVDCKGTGQDGAFLAGVPWPEPRFTNPDGSAPISNGTVVDRLTGLMWTRDAGAPTVGSCRGGAMEWLKALDYIKCLNQNNYLGYSDWRLPNLNELESLVNADASEPGNWLKAQGFLNAALESYWTSTESDGIEVDVWNVFFRNGLVSTSFKWNFRYLAWPVRTWQASGQPAPLWRTGQIHTHGSGDDGELRKGTPWPDPRFLDHGNGTVTDNLTGLTWTKDLKIPGGTPCNPPLTWQKALDYVACLNQQNHLGYEDWRLPNRKELLSLIDYSKLVPSLPTGHPFSNLPMEKFWTSTTFASNPENAWFINSGGAVGAAPKARVSKDIHVWPVRGGKITPSGTRLSMTWASLSQNCRTNLLRKTRCELKGSLSLQNTGSQHVGPLQIQVFLSETENGEGGKTLLKELRAGNLPAGEAKEVPFRYPMPKGGTASGKYLIAVIDLSQVDNAENKTLIALYGPVP